jgi:hypothetical protein
MSEQLPSAEQQSRPEEQSWRELYEAWQIPEENMDALKTEFETSAAEALGKCNDTHIAELVNAGADYYRWLLFSEPGDELPNTLAIVSLQEDGLAQGQLGVRINPNHPAALYGPKGAIEAFTDLAGSRLHNTFVQRFLLNGPEQVWYGPLTELTETVVRETPTFKLLKSFEETNEDGGERALTEQERRFKEADIERETRRKYGMTDTEPLHRGTPAARSMQRQIMQLDDERKPNTKNTETPEQRAQAFFIHQFNAENERNGMPPKSARYRDGVAEVQASTFPGSYVPINIVRLLPAQLIINAMTESYGHKGFYTETIEQQMVEQTLSRLGGNIAWSQKLEEVATHAAYVMRSALRFEFKSGVSVREITSPVFMSLLAPKGPVYDAKEYKNTDSTLPVAALHEQLRFSVARPNIVDREQLEDLLKTPMASVIRRGNAADDTKARVVSQFITGIPEGLPTSTTDADLQLVLTDQFGSTPYFSIPGYDLVAVDRTAYSYQYKRNMESHDPYGPLPYVAVDKQTAINFLNAYGFTAAGEAFAKAEPTVAALVEAIKGTSDYSFTQLPVVENWELPRISRLIPTKTGRAQLQCTGAQVLLKDVLSEMFGPEAVNGLNGYMLEAGNGTMSKAGHAQVLFTYDGKSYILDATPGSEEIVVPGQRTVQRERLRDKLLRRRDKNAALAFVDVAPLDLEDSAEAVQPVHASVQESRPVINQESVREELTATLQRYFKQPTSQKLFGELLKLSQDDPVRRTMSATMRDVTQDELQSLQTYLQNYASKPEVAKRHNLQVYGPALMQTLSQAVQSLINDQSRQN